MAAFDWGESKPFNIAKLTVPTHGTKFKVVLRVYAFQNWIGKALR